MRRSRVLGPFSARVTALAAAMLLIHAAPVAAQQSATAHLEPLAGSGASGTATLTAQGGGTVASLDVAGLIPGGSYAARLHAGSCAQPSASFTPLGTLVPDATGRASASGSVLFRGTDPIPLSTLTDDERVIVVSSSQSAVACGLIPRLAGAPGAQVPAGLPATGEAIDGSPRHLAGALGLALLVTGLLLRCRGFARSSVR